jgi:hypothetical protein
MHCIDAATVKSTGRHGYKIAPCMYTHAQEIKGMKTVSEYRKLHDIVIEYALLSGVKALKTLRLRWAAQVFRGEGGGNA